MPGEHGGVLPDALAEAYGGVSALVDGLGEDDSLVPTGCAGWAVRDLLVHLLGDAQRALVALCTPTDQPADRDRLSYWSDAPGQDAAREADPARLAVRSVRLLGSAWGWQPLTAAWRETAGAVVRTSREVTSREVTAREVTSREVTAREVASRRAQGRVATQGHVLTATDLVSTLVVEAAVHHLDLVEHLPRPGPGPLALAEVRRVLELRHGAPLPGDDATAARYGTGRLAVGGRTLRLLG